MPIYFRSPYEEYESEIANLLSAESRVLEIGAGNGLHTLSVAQTNATVIASDISPNALDVLQRRIEDAGYQISTQVADMEALPFENEQFDVVTSAGSLSYGDNKKVMLEIHRVLKMNGAFICVDSLNHNPVYKFNRWIHYIRGNRTISTLKRMPTLNLIENYRILFGSLRVSYFGSISWLTPIFRILLDDKRVASITNDFDRKFSVKKSAFKYVMVVRKEKK